KEPMSKRSNRNDVVHHRHSASPSYLSTCRNSTSSDQHRQHRWHRVCCSRSAGSPGRRASPKEPASPCAAKDKRLGQVSRSAWSLLFVKRGQIITGPPPVARASFEGGARQICGEPTPTSPRRLNVVPRNPRSGRSVCSSGA